MNQLIKICIQLIIYCLFTTITFSQTIIKGKVIDEDGMPVVAEVFINNSTYKTFCNNDGTFELIISSAPPLDLVVSATAFMPKTIKITEKVPAYLNVTLQQKVMQIDDVTIVAPINEGWEKYGKEFLNDFIGYSSYAQQCKLLNKNVLDFYYDPATFTLTVKARSQLKIVNKATGYTITYYLEDFQKNYKRQTVFLKGFTHFEPTRLNDKKQLKIQANRRAAYNGSLQHFMRSFYNGDIVNEGFEMRIMKRIPNELYGRKVPVYTDTFYRKDSVYFKKMITKIATHDTTDKAKLLSVGLQLMQYINDTFQTTPTQVLIPLGSTDSTATHQYHFSKRNNHPDTIILKYFDFNRLSPKDSAMQQRWRAKKLSIKMDSNSTIIPMHIRAIGFVEMLYSAIIPIDSFRKKEVDGGVLLSFNDFLQVTYTKEKADKIYVETILPQIKNNTENQPQESIISLLNNTDIEVYENGNFYDPYDMLVEKYWSYEKIDKLLPLDYQP